jgi:hypothetical protein
MKTELQIQRHSFANVANNLPDLFTNYKGVVEPFYLARNMPEKVDDPKDNHSNNSSWMQEGERQF